MKVVVEINVPGINPDSDEATNIVNKIEDELVSLNYDWSIYEVARD